MKESHTICLFPDVFLNGNTGLNKHYYNRVRAMSLWWKLKMWHEVTNIKLDEFGIESVDGRSQSLSPFWYPVVNDTNGVWYLGYVSSYRCGLATFPTFDPRYTKRAGSSVIWTRDISHHKGEPYPWTNEPVELHSNAPSAVTWMLLSPQGWITPRPSWPRPMFHKLELGRTIVLRDTGGDRPNRVT